MHTAEKRENIFVVSPRAKTKEDFANNWIGSILEFWRRNDGLQSSATEGIDKSYGWYVHSYGKHQYYILSGRNYRKS